MHTPDAPARPPGPRDVHFFAHPELWPTWPFLPVVRRRPGREPELGLLYDCKTVGGRMGHSATVWLCNLFLLPPTEDDFLALPRETFDTPEEVAAAGWVVD